MAKGMGFLSVLCVGFVIMSCGTGKNVASSVVIDGDWDIVSVDGNILNIEEGVVPTIGFDVNSHRIYGNSGCNRIMGVYKKESSNSNDLSFDQLGSTRMFCPNMSVESSILTALGKVKSYQLVFDEKGKGNASDKLALCDDKGRQLLMIKKTPLNMSNLNGEWKIVELKGAPVEVSTVAPFLGFDVNEARIYGNAGCNNINGTLEQDKKDLFSLKFGQGISTMMDCPEMATEGAILSTLNEVRSFKFQGKDKVELLDQNGKQLMQLIKR